MSHPLDGPRLRIQRARSQIDMLRGLEKAFRDVVKFEVTKGELNPKTGLYTYHVRVPTVTPLDDWGVYIGEIAHNLHSTLDGLVYQLALITTKSPARNTQFPIFLVGRPKDRNRFHHCFEGVRTKGGKVQILTADGRAMIRQLRPEHQAMIEQLQPYKRGRGGRKNPLYLLKEINNADKHRLIPIVGPISGAGPVTSYWEGESEPTIIRVSRKILKDGAEILSAAPEVHVGQDIYPLIVFADGCPGVARRGVRHVLGKIADQVSEVVETFATEFD